jgi:tetratricopeptide (TPR) repeat protein
MALFDQQNLHQRDRFARQQRLRADMHAGERPGQGSPPGSHLTPPGSAPAARSDASTRQWLIWGSLVLVILLGLLVLFVLPKMVADGPRGQAAGGAVAEGSVKAGSITEEERQTPVSSQQAARALQDFLLAQARLELANAPVWGQPQWSQAVEGAARGNELFGRGEFSGAKDEFERSLDLLTGLESEAGQRLAAALASGWQALELNESDTAAAFFETAIAIDSGNEEAASGLERARARPELLRLMDAGNLALSVRELEKARDFYHQATLLDGSYEPAEAALQDVNAEITELQFNAAMSQALTAIGEAHVKAAETALTRAESLKPGQQVVADTRFQLDQLKRELWLAGQRRSGAENEAGENWAAAVAVYRDVLAREPRAAFARQGLERAEDRALLHGQLDHYLEDPGRVYSAEPRANAEILLASAGQPPADEPRLADKIRRLETLVAEAKTPVPVTLQSDGQTSVSVYHVGRLGAFITQQLELPPGTYTVVGSRPGYRDVRKTLDVKPGSAEISLAIQCEESI